jgi:hypothetical protein
MQYKIVFDKKQEIAVKSVGWYTFIRAIKLRLAAPENVQVLRVFRFLAIR